MNTMGGGGGEDLLSQQHLCVVHMALLLIFNCVVVVEPPSNCMYERIVENPVENPCSARMHKKSHLPLADAL
jgi:hypothetical protein